MGRRSDRRSIAHQSRGIGVFAFGREQRILECPSRKSVRETSWLLRGVKGRHDLRGHGGLYWWGNGNVPNGRNTAELVQHIVKSLREELVTGLFHRGELAITIFTLPVGFSRLLL